MKLSLPLDVKIAKEGYLRLFAYWTIMTLLFFTALWCLLYEIVLLTVVDKDTRDMTFDYRITHSGIRMLATAYWPKSLGIIDDMDVDVLRPSMDIPVLVIYIGRLASCQGTTGNACNQVKPRPDGGAEREDDPMQMLMAVEKSISRDPGKIRVVQHRNNTMTEVPQLGVYILQEKQPEVLISPGSVDQAEVDVYIDNVIDKYTDPAYIAPRDRGNLVSLYDAVSVQNMAITTVLQTSYTEELKKIGWPRELVYWGFGRCPDTNQTVYWCSGSFRIRRDPIASSGGLPVVPRLQLVFLGDQSASVDWYSLELISEDEISVAPLIRVQIRVLMVPQAGNCCAWRLVEALGEYSTDRRIGPISAGPSLFPSDNVEVEMEIRDVGQAKPAYFPRLKGPALVYCGIITGGISVIMLGLTPVLLFIIYHNVMVNNGIPPPWFKYSSKYRGW